VDVQGTRNVDAAASADVLLNFELPSDGSAAIFGACVLVGPITNATTGESLDPLPSQSVRREQEGELGLTDGVDDDVGGPWRTDYVGTAPILQEFLCLQTCLLPPR
jgi:hypothetical protein